MLQNLKKVHEDIFERSIKGTLVPLPSSGNSYHEFDHKYCVSNIPELDGYIIVVSKKLIYKNSSLVDFERVYYLYDKDGNYVDNKYIIDKFEDFYETLEEIVEK
jgi:hypothetical protein